jgi:ABC-type uncharacterized transport system auxiliary subunit
MKTRSPLTLTVLLCTLALAGCGGLLTSKQPARQYYLLQPLNAAGGGFEGGQNTVLRLGLDVIPGLDTDRILALDPDARLASYANARWPDHLPEVLSSVLRRSLESTGRFARVETGGRGADGDWILDLELRGFYGIRDGAGSTGSVRVALAGSLACGSETHRLDLADGAPVAEERLAAIVAAHQAALDSVTRDLVEQLGNRCRDHPDPAP